MMEEERYLEKVSERFEDALADLRTVISEERNCALELAGLVHDLKEDIPLLTRACSDCIPGDSSITMIRHFLQTLAEQLRRDLVVTLILQEEDRA